MNKKDLRIVYMGTPDFAVAPLKRLVENGFNIAGVITVADKPAGRGRKLRQSAVKIYAESKGLNILQPTNLKDPGFIAELKNLRPQLQVVVAFRMLPEVVWKLPEIGTFNLHASLLPQYRGAAPINWAIINGEKETGVTTFFIEKEIDTGAILLQEKISIGDDDTAGVLHDKLMKKGAQLVEDTCTLILEGKQKSVRQEQFIKSEKALKPAPKIFKPDCEINWNRSNIQVYNFIRGLSPYPGAFCRLSISGSSEKTLKIFKAKMAYGGFSADAGLQQAGKITVIDRRLIAYTADGALELEDVQLAGKKRMPAADFIRGVNFN